MAKYLIERTVPGAGQMEDIILEHGRGGGSPVDAVDEIRATIDPSTAELVS